MTDYTTNYKKGSYSNDVDLEVTVQGEPEQLSFDFYYDSLHEICGSSLEETEEKLNKMNIIGD